MENVLKILLIKLQIVLAIKLLLFVNNVYLDIIYKHLHFVKELKKLKIVYIMILLVITQNVKYVKMNIIYILIILVLKELIFLKSVFNIN